MHLFNTLKILTISTFAVVLVFLIGVTMSNASSQKVHKPVVEEIGELTDEELLKMQKEFSEANQRIRPFY